MTGPTPAMPRAASAQDKKSQSTGDSIDWNDVNTTLICNLFAEQVRKGNRPNTHLNPMGYTEVSERFFQSTKIELSKLQLKNKWDKLKIDLTIWQKLMKRQTGTGFDYSNGVIVMDNEWWKKAKKDIPGCGKFRRKKLQNEDELIEIFGDIKNDGADHWNPMSKNPIIPRAPEAPIDVETEIGVGDEEINDIPFDTDNFGVGGEEVEVISPSIGNAKKRPRIMLDKPKKGKLKTAYVIQEQITKIADSATSMASKKEREVTVKQVMDVVVACGATYDTNEHYIATELFVKKDQRDMFMTLPTDDVRFNWLKRKYNDKYEK